MFADRKLKVADAEEGGAENEELSDKDEDGGVHLALVKEEQAEKCEDDGGEEGESCESFFIIVR